MSIFNKWCIAVSLAFAILNLPAYALSDIEYAVGTQVGLPEKKIDVGIAALTFAKEFYPEIDVTAYSRKIDALANQVKRMANGTEDPEQRVRVMNTVLFRMEGFHYDLDPFSRSRQEYYFLNGILDTKQGICYTLPLLYIAVAQRVGYPIYPVSVPDHIFVRYVDPKFKEQNIEVTSRGKYYDDASYIEDFAISSRGLKSGAYLRTMTYREFLGQMLSANAYYWARKGYGKRGIAYFEKSVELYPTCATCYFNLSSAYAGLSEANQGEWSLKFKEKSKQYELKLKQLGYVDPSEIKLKRELRGK